MLGRIKFNISFFLIKLVSLDYWAIKRVIKRWSRRNETVLDLGCGNGYLAPAFSSKGYLGVDSDPLCIEIAKKTYPKHKFITANATKVDLEKKFDLVLIVGLIHHLDNKETRNTINVIKRHLKKGGRVLVIEAIPPMDKWNVLGRLIRSVDHGEHVRPLKSYLNILDKQFSVKYAKQVRGGIVDYGVFVLKN